MKREDVGQGTHRLMVGKFELELRDVEPGDEASVLGLHERVFGSGAGPAWYAWKYGSGLGQGGAQAVGVWCDGTLIAHCAGIPRVLWRSGTVTNGLQIGDVMVDPSWRGILTRRGPFFYASRRLYESRLGPLGERPFQLGFGFPNERHMRLAVKSHLAWDGGRLHVLRWPLPEHEHGRAMGWGWQWEALSPSSATALEDVERAWLTMRQDAATITLGQRDSQHVRWRYLDRPDQAYQLFRLRRAWSTRLVGIAVLKLQGSQAAWLDWIGPQGWLAFASKACQAEAKRVGATELTAWASPLVVDALQGTGGQLQRDAACIGVPAASSLTANEVGALNWWAMGGDTDFL